MRRILVYPVLPSRFSLLALGLCCLGAPLKGQPSGGPYGPLHQSYDLPEKGDILYVAPGGEPQALGKDIGRPTTLQAAVKRATTGDAIILRGGTYRTGGLVSNQGIILQPYADEKPVVKGTLVADAWENLNNGLWRTKWPHLFPGSPEPWWRRHREGIKTPVVLFNNDMVFVDGKLLKAVGWEGEVDNESFFIDYDSGYVYIGIDPSDRLVEITAHDFAFTWTTEKVHGHASDRKGPQIRGITFTQYAYRAFEFEGYDPEGISDESQHGKDRIGTTIEHCEISFCSRVAGYFRGDHLTIRHCLVSDTSTEGIFILNSSDVLLEKNIIRRNNIEQITGYYPAAVKIYNQCYRVTCRDNLVIDHPYSSGIWYDVGNVDGLVLNNWFEGVGLRHNIYSTNQIGTHRNAFFFEISKGAICAGNVFLNCEQGMNIYNSADVQLYNNTFINSKACFGRTDRGMGQDHFGWHPTTGPAYDERDGHVFANNLMYAVEAFPHPLLSVWQMPTLAIPGGKPQIKDLDNNVYIRGAVENEAPLVLYSPVNPDDEPVFFDSLQALQKRYPQAELNSLFLHDGNRSPFLSIELKNFELIDPKQVNPAARTLPERIRKQLDARRGASYVGAYP